MCEGIPFCTAGEQSRPATDPDSPACQYLHGYEGPTRPEQQKSYIDETIFGVQDQDEMQRQKMDTERQGANDSRWSSRITNAQHNFENRMLPRDVSRESAAEIFWTCRPQGHAVCLLSKGPCHCPIHQVMRTSHVRKIQPNRPTRRCSHRIWSSIRGGYCAHCFPSWKSSEKQYSSSETEKKEKRRNSSITKKREKRESREVRERVGHQSERRMDTVAKVRCWKALSR